MFGTSASVCSSILLILKPASFLVRYTLASVATRFGVKPARLKPAARAIEKQPAWAAPISSSGLVPTPSSKRDEKEYEPSNAPLPSLIFPLPCCKLPSQTALAVRAGIIPPGINADISIAGSDQPIAYETIRGGASHRGSRIEDRNQYRER